MNNLINNLNEIINDDNEEIVSELIDIITSKNINTEKELLDYENYKFTIDGKVLTLIEKIEYCKKNLINSFIDADILDFEEATIYYEYIESLKKETSIDNVIKYIAKLYNITNRPILLVSQTYNLLVNKKI